MFSVLILRAFSYDARYCLYTSSDSTCPDPSNTAENIEISDFVDEFENKYKGYFDKTVEYSIDLYIVTSSADDDKGIIGVMNNVLDVRRVVTLSIYTPGSGPISYLIYDACQVFEKIIFNNVNIVFGEEPFFENIEVTENTRVTRTTDNCNANMGFYCGPEYFLHSFDSVYMDDQGSMFFTMGILSIPSGFTVSSNTLNIKVNGNNFGFNIINSEKIVSAVLDDMPESDKPLKLTITFPESLVLTVQQRENTNSKSTISALYTITGASSGSSTAYKFTRTASSGTLSDLIAISSYIILAEKSNSNHVVQYSIESSGITSSYLSVNALRSLNFAQASEIEIIKTGDDQFPLKIIHEVGNLTIRVDRGIDGVFFGTLDLIDTWNSGYRLNQKDNMIMIEAKIRILMFIVHLNFLGYMVIIFQ